MEKKTTEKEGWLVALSMRSLLSCSRSIKLPDRIHDWRRPDLLPNPIEDEKLWEYLLDLFREVGLVPWEPYVHGCEIISPSPGSIVSANGYCYVPPSRGIEGSGPGAAEWMGVFSYMVRMGLLHHQEFGLFDDAFALSEPSHPCGTDTRGAGRCR